MRILLGSVMLLGVMSAPVHAGDFFKEEVAFSCGENKYKIVSVCKNDENGEKRYLYQDVVVVESNY